MLTRVEVRTGRSMTLTLPRCATISSRQHDYRKIRPHFLRLNARDQSCPVQDERLFGYYDGARAVGHRGAHVRNTVPHGAADLRGSEDLADGDAI
jgi:hypothetical protein